MYKNQGFKVETRPISVRLRRDILEWFEMSGINKNAFINDVLFIYVKAVQRDQKKYQKWMRKNR